jgi:hypothetical protein
VEKPDLLKDKFWNEIIPQAGAPTNLTTFLQCALYEMLTCNHGLTNYKETKIKCLYWCSIEFTDWRYSLSYWYF